MLYIFTLSVEIQVTGGFDRHSRFSWTKAISGIMAISWPVDPLFVNKQALAQASWTEVPLIACNRCENRVENANSGLCVRIISKGHAFEQNNGS